MGESIALISSAVITETELSDLIVRADGFVEPGTPLFGRFSDGPRHIWIGLSMENPAAEDGGEEYLAEVTGLLGGPPRTDVIVEISRTDGSERLALEFAILFSATWPAIMDDFQGHLLTRDDLLRRQAAGQAVWTPVADTPQAA